MLKNNNYFRSKVILQTFLVSNLLITSNALADGFSIDKVYHPYVQPLEREIEFRSLNYEDPTTSENIQVYRLGLGASFATNWFAEAYVIGEKNPNDFKVNGYELEAKVQLTEQGEYSADWGLLFELEKEAKRSIIEFAGTLLIEKEWGRSVGTANLSLIFESGDGLESRDGVTSELETAAAFQLRYRYSQALEPAIELYLGQNTSGLGPVLMGQKRFGARKKLHWEIGVIAGLSDETPDTTLRALAEFEF